MAKSVLTGLMIKKKFVAKLQTFFRGKYSDFTVSPDDWDGNLIRFYFEDERFNNSGTIHFQADTKELQIKPDKPYTPLMTKEEVQEYFAQITESFIKFYQFGWSPSENEMPQYDHLYHSRIGYLVPDDQESRIKEFQAKVIQDLANPKKILVAGCSSGELVRQLTLLGITTHGFDVITDIHEYAIPEVSQLVKKGSVQDVPYLPEDDFDTYVAVDVMEHIPERDIEQVMREWLRLNIKKLVLLINFNQFNFEGHVTLRPHSWWESQWQQYFKMTKTFQLKEEKFYNNDNDSNHIWTLWERV